MRIRSVRFVSVVNIAEGMMASFSESLSLKSSQDDRSNVARDGTRNEKEIRMVQKKSKPDHMDVNDARQKPQGDRESPGQDRQSWPLPVADAALVKPGTGPTWAADPDRQPTGGKPLSLAALKRREAVLIGKFSETTKMPWLAWSISAEKCKVGSRLRKVSGSVCSECYALKGYYSYPSSRRRWSGGTASWPTSTVGPPT